MTPRKPKKPKVHDEDRNLKRKNLVLAEWKKGKSAGEISEIVHATRETVIGIVARAGLSRGEKPAAPVHMAGSRGLARRLIVAFISRTGANRPPERGTPDE